MARTRKNILPYRRDYGSIEERFHQKYEIVAQGGCWMWTRALTRNGYAMFTANKRMVRAHRFSYELLVGPIPDGLVLDHLCGEIRCVNPNHLEPVSAHENRRRQSVRQTHCRRGHPLSGANLYVSRKGERSCLTCHRKDSPQRRGLIFTYAWKNNARRAELRGRRCVIEASGRMGTTLVRFLDTGERVTTSRRALRRTGDFLCPMNAVDESAGMKDEAA